MINISPEEYIKAKKIVAMYEGKFTPIIEESPKAKFEQHLWTQRKRYSDRLLCFKEYSSLRHCNPESEPMKNLMSYIRTLVKQKYYEKK